MIYDGKAKVRSVTESGQNQDQGVLEKGDYCGHHTLLQDAGEGNAAAPRYRVASMTAAMSTGHGHRQGTGEPHFVIAETACTCANFSIPEFRRRFGDVLSGSGSSGRNLLMVS